ncbi:FAD-dependent oxidoreductase [Paenibacillus sp. LHD-117]|uniref:FAD-dependent oxidoreductase n=1 Tax=Paenibacillus sp. LHD-117 TaxID=3071412 RepID=UPI0027DEB29C|nr:FAD-dependent oxidoreductase [Paenibacillus sp. LHD-117]MDQ6420052.1 FAD-dependent oxidoreductase [Paenibacillus sp. LHD-117]
MRAEEIRKDVVVVGGGLAGVSAAIAAARNGSKVALINNRPVLGGNSSSEVRVWVCGATSHGVNRFARETGIMGELFVENQYRNPDGNPYLWDAVVLEAVKAEPNLELFLNTDVHEVEADGGEDDRTIRSVTGWMMGSERRIRFAADLFLDCTGDGLVGFLAGAKHRIGREARHEYNEEWAPEQADDITLGSTILFYTKDVGHPVRFVPPSFAKDITGTSIPMKRVIRSGDSGCHYWWIEWGGELDTVHENERIRDELWAVIYGIWDYIKNSGQFEADNMTLEWVGSIPGKREYRRFVGDYVLTQNDIIAQREFEDRVAFGGWSIDLHPPQGMYATESGSKHMHPDGIYHIPYRSLYSINVNNMLFAGRNISATHVAFGTTRVMATCAVMGEAAGTAASLCSRMGVTPRELYRSHLHDLQLAMQRQDSSVIGLAVPDEGDLAGMAVATASSAQRSFDLAESDGETYPLANETALLLPVERKLTRLELLLDASADTELRVQLWDTGRPENYVPGSQIAAASVKVAKGERQWVALDLSWVPDRAQNAFMIVERNDAISLHQSAVPMTGVIAFEKRKAPNASQEMEEKLERQPVLDWSMKRLVRHPFCFRSDAADGVYEAHKALDGYLRPYGGPHLWVSEPMRDGEAEYVQLDWQEDVTIGSVQLIWNDDVNEDLINLHHHRTAFEVIPELARDYRIEALVEEEWRQVAAVRGNRKRRNKIALERPVKARALRVTVEATNGSRHAELSSIGVYG